MYIMLNKGSGADAIEIGSHYAPGDPHQVLVAHHRYSMDTPASKAPELTVFSPQHYEKHRLLAYVTAHVARGRQCS